MLRGLDGTQAALQWLMARNVPELPGDAEVTASELAQWLATTRNGVNHLARRGVLQRSRRGRFPLRASVAAAVRYHRDRVVPAALADVITYNGVVILDEPDLSDFVFTVDDLERAVADGQVLAPAGSRPRPRRRTQAAL